MKTRRYGKNEVAEVVERLRAGETLALPTETVYGLAANAFSSASVLKIFSAKERPSFDPLILHLAESLLKAEGGLIPALIQSGILDESVRTWRGAGTLEHLMRQFWPGPLTLILPKGPKIPSEVTSGSLFVGIRMPRHPLFQEVLCQLDFPLAAPSANRFGRISPTTADHVLAELEGRIEGVLDGGACVVGVESTILALEETPHGTWEARILRPGQIAKSALEHTLGVRIGDAPALGEHNQRVLAPGLLEQHYAPRKPLLLFPRGFGGPSLTPAMIIQEVRKAGFQGRIAFLCFDSASAHRFPLTEKTAVLAPDSKSETAAQQLFSLLRILDEDPAVELIVAELPENTEEGLGAAIADRLNRASVNKPLLRR